MHVHLLFLLLFFSPLCADWNQTFDDDTKRLAEHFPAFQTTPYIEQYRFFMNARKALLKDAKIQKKVLKTAPEKKKLIIKKEEKLIIKKRRNNHIHDLYVWELSHLLNAAPACIVPSFPIDLGGKRAIVQQIESLQYGDTTPAEALQKIPLENYWKSHLVAYLLGLSDLAGRNIGITSDGKIRFFDNEASFIYYNHPSRTARAFTSGFLSQSFDWPQFRQSLDETTATHLQQFVDNLADFEEKVRLYKTIRPLTFPEEGLAFRLQVLRKFPMKEGASFRDFYMTAFPDIAAGLTKLNEIVSSILKQKVGDGTTLFFTCRRMVPSQLQKEQLLAIHDWVHTYIPQ